MRQTQDKEYDHEKRSAESEIDKEMRQTQDKEYHRQKRSAESDIEKERRLTKDKSTKHKRYTQATQFRAKKIQELIEKRYKEYHKEKRSAESQIEKERRLTKDKATHKKTYRQPTKDWKQELIDKASLTHICTSECRYRPKASMVVVKDKMFTSEEMKLLTMNNETLSIDGKQAGAGIGGPLLI